MIFLLVIIVFLIILFFRSKKIFYIVLLSFISVFIILLATIFINHKTTKLYTLEEIANIKLSEIDHLDTNNKYKNNLEDFKEEYKNIFFRKDKYIDEIISEKIFGTILTSVVPSKYTCYDEENNIIVEIVFLRK